MERVVASSMRTRATDGSANQLEKRAAVAVAAPVREMAMVALSARLRTALLL